MGSANASRRVGRGQQTDPNAVILVHDHQSTLSENATLLRTSICCLLVSRGCTVLHDGQCVRKFISVVESLKTTSHDEFSFVQRADPRSPPSLPGELFVPVV